MLVVIAIGVFVCAFFLGVIAFYLRDEHKTRIAESFRMKKRK